MTETSPSTSNAPFDPCAPPPIARMLAFDDPPASESLVVAHEPKRASAVSRSKSLIAPAVMGPGAGARSASAMRAIALAIDGHAAHPDRSDPARGLDVGGGIAVDEQQQ